MNLLINFQFKIGFIDRSPSATYDPIMNRFTGGVAKYYNKQLELYNSINYTVVLDHQRNYGDCDSVNCTGLIGLVQRGEVDFSEKLYSFAAISESITGLKPGPVIDDVSCNIISALPKIGIVREDVFKSLSIFTLDALIFLTFIYLFLFSMPFILWYFKSKFCDIKTNSPPIIWPLICAILLQISWFKTLFYRQYLSLIWMLILLTLFFLSALYSSSFKTDLTSQASIKKIDSLEDVADCDRVPFWMEEPLCRIIANSGSPRAQREIARRGKYKTLGDLVEEFAADQGIDRYVFIITAQEFDLTRLVYCIISRHPTIPQWYQPKSSFPANLLFSVLNSKLSPRATKIINLLHEKQFESGLVSYIRSKWKLHVAKVIDPGNKSDCLPKTSISFVPALYRFNQLDIQNYKLLYKYFLYMIPICILSFIGEYLYALKIHNNVIINL